MRPAAGTASLALAALVLASCGGSESPPAAPPKPAATAVAEAVAIPTAPAAPAPSAPGASAPAPTAGTTIAEAAPTPAPAPTPTTATATATAPTRATTTSAPARPAPTTVAPAALATAPKPVVPTATAPPAPTAAPVATAPAAGTAAPAAPAAATTPAGAKKIEVDDPGGRVEVKAPKGGLKRVGVDRCGNCHEIQQDSWKTSGHAKRDPPLDCEGCHGPGSEYKKSSIMKDEALSKKAGLVMPGKDFCTRCHRVGWTEQMLEDVHEHGKVTADEEEEE